MIFLCATTPLRPLEKRAHSVPVYQGNPQHAAFNRPAMIRNWGTLLAVVGAAAVGLLFYAAVIAAIVRLITGGAG